MPAPRQPINVEHRKVQELHSSSSHEALDVEETKSHRKEERRDRSRSRDVRLKDEDRRDDDNKGVRAKDRQTTLRSKGLPPGWERVKSKTKPGAYYYVHRATNRTQTELPRDIYAGLEPIADSGVKPTSTSIGKPLGPKNPTPADKLKAVAEEAEKKRKESEDARKRSQERALLKKQELDNTLKRVREEEQAEEDARQEELRRVREKQREKKLEVAESDRDRSQSPAGVDDRDTLKTKLDKGKGRPRVGGLFVGKSTFEPAPKSPEPAPKSPEPVPKSLEFAPEPKLTKKEKKEAKKRKKKEKKEQKLQKQIKKAEKKLMKSKEVLRQYGGSRRKCSSSSSSSSSSS